MSKMGLNKDHSAFKLGLRSLMKRLANNSKNFFQLKNFQQQAFVDVPRKRWKPLKKPRPGLILVKTGRMRRSAFSRVTSSRTAFVRFDTPYASFHNEGTSRIPKRQFSGESKLLNKENEKIILNYVKSKLK